MTIRDIIDEVSATYGVSKEDICGSSKASPAVMARRHAMQIAYQHGHGINHIARQMGVSIGAVSKGYRAGNAGQLPIREVLPERRRTTNVKTEWKDQQITVGVGVNAAHEPKEVFADTKKPGTDIAAMLSDACILGSLALQFGCPPETLAKSLGKVPAIVDGEEVEAHASPIGAIMEVMVEEAGR